MRKTPWNVWGKRHRKFFRWDCLISFQCRPICPSPILGDKVWQSVKAMFRLLAVELRSLQRRRNEHFQIICFFEHESDISDSEFLPFTCECPVWPGDTFLGLVSESWFSGILTRSHPPVWPLAVRFRSGNYLSRLFLHLTDTRWVTGSNLKPFTTVKHWVCISHPSIS